MLLDLLYPRLCIGCGAWGVYLCSRCLNRVRPKEATICPVCTKPSAWGRAHPACRSRYSLDGLWTGFEYKGLMQQLIGKLKYHYVTDVTETVTELVISLPDWSYLPQANWLVVPVPLHKSRYRQRGFNQADLLGRAVASYLGSYYCDKLVERIRATTPQMELHRRQRLTNLDDAFAYVGPPSGLKGLSVLLVDDVWTTGTTLRQVGRVVKQAGASQVWCLVVAR